MRWTLLPRMYPEILAAERDLRLYWTRHLPAVVGFVLLCSVPAVRSWTGLSPGVCAVAVLVHALAYGAEVHFAVSERFGVRPYTSLVLPLNLAVAAAICASPGRFVAPVWALYFMYLFMAARAAGPSLLLAACALVGPPAMARAYASLDAFSPKTEHSQLWATGVLAGATYALLANHHVSLRARGLELEEERRARDRQAQRRALADDLHDSLGAALAEVAMWQDVGRAAEGPSRGEALERASRRLRGAMVELRAAVATMQDQALDAAALEGLLRARLAGLCEAAGVALELRVEGASSLEGRAAHQLLRVAEEATSNAVRHGSPRRLQVALALGEETTLRVEDDGAGFDPAAVAHGNGLDAMRRRAAELGATLSIAPGARTGTVVELRRAAGEAA